MDPGQRAAYHERGTCVVRGVLSGEWIDRTRQAVDRILQDPGPGSVEYTPEGKLARYDGADRKSKGSFEFRELPVMCNPGVRQL